MKKNNITCLLTTHNKENLIELVSNGIIQNVSDLTKQIVVVFDGCVDNTENLTKDIFKNFKGRVDYVYTEDVFELKANNAGLKVVESEYVILIQDDMVIKEKDFDKRMVKPFQTFSDVFAVTSQTSHNNRVVNNHLQVNDAADRRLGTPRDIFAIREIANRGPLMYNYSDLVSLNYFDENLCPSSYDDHDISYKAYEKFGKVSGLYWIDYDSDPNWGTTRQKNINIHNNAHSRNSKIIMDRYSHLLNGEIKNENRDLK